MSVSAYYDRDFDAMPGRALVARWMLTAALRLETAAHFGGQGDSALDMPILRCARTGLPHLPGTSLGGALRAYLLDRFAGFLTDEIQKENNDSFQPTAEADRVAMLFGAVRGLDIEKHTQSPLIVFDAWGTLPADSASTEVRDGVLIESATGIAADQKKFDFEVLPPGTAFNVRLDVLVSADDDENNLLALLCASLEGLENGDIRIGLRRSRGLGEVACGNWTAQRYALSTPEGWLAWISSDHVSEPDPSSQLSIRGAIQSVMPPHGTLDDQSDNRQRVIIEVEAAILGDLLIRSPNAQANGPDVMHLSSGGRPILSGTSLTGVMRAQALRITQLVQGLSRRDAERLWIAPLFGPREERTRNPDFQPRGSRLRVSERPVANGQSRRVTRVAIDRFTQGVVPTALFDEQPYVGGTVQLRFELRNPRDGEIGLLLLVLKDLLTGELPIGGTSSIGRGVLVGRRMTMTGSGIQEPIEVSFDAAEARRGRIPVSSELNRLVRRFVQAVPAAAELEGGNVMNTVIGNPEIAGARITPMNAEQANAWLNWLSGNGQPLEPLGVQFALAQSDSGVMWGYLDEQQQWKVGAAVDPGLCPVPTAKSLHELRLFGNTAEVLIWRSDDELLGRILADDGIAFDASDPLRPMNEGRRLRGECREMRDGFKRHVDAGGAQHLAPESFPEEFSVRHYFEQDPATGAVRIAATRLVPEKLS